MPIDHSKINLSIVYEPKESSHAGTKFDPRTYYYMIYNKVPNFIQLDGSGKRFFSYDHILSVLVDEYSFDANDTLNGQSYNVYSSDSLTVTEEICDLKNGIVVHLSGGHEGDKLSLIKDGLVSDVAEKGICKKLTHVNIYYTNDKLDECKSLIAKFKKVLYCYGSKGIKIICKNCNQFYVTIANVRDPKIEDLNLNYGKEFGDVHKKINEWLFDSKSEGIILLHGPPGTGKTSYLRYLMNRFDTKDFIYMPPNLSEHISDPSFLPFLMQNKNSILIIEDAENVIKDRQDPTVKTQAIANLLNISDGLLGDSLHQKIIATFNCDLSKIDPALLRKGRLITQYKFDKLSIDEAQILADHLNIKSKISEPMTLAEIYSL